MAEISVLKSPSDVRRIRPSDQVRDMLRSIAERSERVFPDVYKGFKEVLRIHGERLAMETMIVRHGYDVIGFLEGAGLEGYREPYILVSVLPFQSTLPLVRLAVAVTDINRVFCSFESDRENCVCSILLMPVCHYISDSSLRSAILHEIAHCALGPSEAVPAFLHVMAETFKPDLFENPFNYMMEEEKIEEMLKKLGIPIAPPWMIDAMFVKPEWVEFQEEQKILYSLSPHARIKIPPFS